MTIPNEWIRDSIAQRDADSVIEATFRCVSPEGITCEQFCEAFPSEDYFEVEEFVEGLDENSEIRCFESPYQVPAEQLGGWGIVRMDNGQQVSHLHFLINAYSTRHPLEGTGSPGDPSQP